jgi:PiT family inorganic phosphate transporter
MLDLITYVLGFVLIALVSGNNLSVCFGSVIASRVISRTTAVMLTIIGYALGLLLQGNLLGHTISVLLPSTSALYIDTALGVSIAIFVVSQLKSIPQSLSITLTAALVGIDAAAGIALKLDFIAYVMLFWIMMPVICSVFVLVLMRLIKRKVITSHVWGYVGIVKLILIVSSFFVAFTLGGNTIGLVVDLMSGGPAATIVAIVAIVAGAVAFNSGPLKRVGNEIIPLRYLNAASAQIISALMVEVATLYGIPLSNTQTFVASVYGAGVSYKHRLIMRHPFFAMVSMWIATAIAALIAGFVVISILV